MTTNNTNQNNTFAIDGTQYRNLISTKFEGVIPSMTLVDQERTEQEIRVNGIPFPLMLAEIGNNSSKYELVTGNFEYKMALKHELPFSIIIKKFDTDDEVIRFIIVGTLNRVNLNLFQKGELVLTHQDILVKKGKENMILGGKGSKVSEKDRVDTMVQLGAMIGTSHDTLRKVRCILNEPKNEEFLNQLRSGDISINKVYEELTGKKKVKVIVEQNRKDYFSDFLGDDNTIKTSLDINPNIEVPAQSKFHFDVVKKYQLIYLKPKWNVTNMIVLPDTFLEELQKMNLSEIGNEKFCTLLIQTPSKYLAETMRIVESWKFVCVDTICVSGSESSYSSNYSDQNHEILLVCEFKGVGIPTSLINNRSTNSIIDANIVFETIDKMFDRNLSKLCVFIEPLEGWDSFEFDNETKMMVNYNKSAA